MGFIFDGGLAPLSFFLQMEHFELEAAVNIRNIIAGQHPHRHNKQNPTQNPPPYLLFGLTYFLHLSQYSVPGSLGI
jgi:hypothetical protein